MMDGFDGWWAQLERDRKVTWETDKGLAQMGFQAGLAQARREVEVVMKAYSLPSGEDDLEWAVSRTTLERVEIFMVSRAKKDWAAKTAIARVEKLAGKAG